MLSFSFSDLIAYITDRAVELQLWFQRHRTCGVQISNMEPQEGLQSFEYERTGISILIVIPSYLRAINKFFSCMSIRFF